jgi:hypothetical protein
MGTDWLIFALNLAEFHPGFLNEETVLGTTASIRDPSGLKDPEGSRFTARAERAGGFYRSFLREAVRAPRAPDE